MLITMLADRFEAGGVLRAKGTQVDVATSLALQWIGDGVALAVGNSRETAQGFRKDVPVVQDRISGQQYAGDSPVSGAGNAGDWAVIDPTRGGALVAGAIQFRGGADTASSLGTIGLVINAASDAAAGGRLAASDTDWSSNVNGSSTAGRTRMIGPVGGAITRVHIGQLGLTAPLTDNASGPVLAASNQMTELNFDSALGVTALLIVEGGPTNFAGAAGTGSARYVTVYGLVPVAAS